MVVSELLQEKREEILCICAKYGARNVRVFGSAARGEAGAGSDMNLPANEVRIQDANNWISENDLSELGAKPFPPSTVVLAKTGRKVPDA